MDKKDQNYPRKRTGAQYEVWMGSEFIVDAKVVEVPTTSQHILSSLFSRIVRHDFPVDSKEKLEAAEQSTDISSKWTKETLAKLSAVATVKEEPTDHTKALADFASAQAEMTAETMAAFDEFAKKVQMKHVELMLAASNDISEDATAAVKKATAEVTAAAKKVVNRKISEG